MEKGNKDFVEDSCTTSSSQDEAHEETMKIHSGKLLSELIAKEVEFYTPAKTKIVDNESRDILKLFHDHEVIDINEHSLIEYPQQKPKITRRNVEPEVLSEKEKIKLAAVDLAFIQYETQFWKSRRKSQVFHYKSKSGTNHQFVEPEGEFSKLRKKNCWSEKRISRTFNK